MFRLRHAWPLPSYEEQESVAIFRSRTAGYISILKLYLTSYQQYLQAYRKRNSL
jgi:hypothetical protein